MIPDEFCPHVEIGAEMAGGILFSAEEPPVLVGMCANCLAASRAAFETLTPMDESEQVLRWSDEEVRQSFISEGRDPDQVANEVRAQLINATKEVFS